MTSKRPASKGTTSRLAELGPALTGLGTLLAGVAAVIALIVTRPSDAPAATTQPTMEVSTQPSAAASPTVAASGAASDAPSTPPASTAISLERLLADVRLIAARTGVPTEPGDYDEYVVIGPLAGMAAEVPKAWPDRAIDLWRDLPPDATASAVDEELGSILFASADEEALFVPGNEAYRVPTFIASASRRIASDFRQGSILDMRNITYGLRCTLEQTGAVEWEGYSGRYEIFAECGESSAMTIQVESIADDGSHVLGLTARVATSADIAAFERGVRTLRIEADRLLR